MSPLLQALVLALELPRELPPQVVHHLLETYGLDAPALGSFLVDRLPGLEDYEIDLALSPLFTPTLQDQVPFAELLGGDSVPKEQWPGLLQELLDRPTVLRLVTTDGRTHSVPAKGVTLERYVHRLRLEGTVPDPLLHRIQHLVPPASRPMLLAIARRAIWETAPRLHILTAFLETALDRDARLLDDTGNLLRWVETYEPSDLADLLARLPGWQRSLQQQINEAGGPKTFFNERVEEMHGGGRDQRRGDNSRILAKKSEFAFLERLQRALEPVHS